MAQELWQKLEMNDCIQEATNLDLSGSVILEHLHRLQDNTLTGFEFGKKELISMTCWYLWWMRRQRTHDEPVPPIPRCKISILGIAANAFRSLSQKKMGDEARWHKPEPRQVKLNVDASFHSDTCSGSIGAVIRDYKGSLLAATCKFLSHVSSAAMAEALAMRKGLRLINSSGHNVVQAESDSLETIEACTGDESWWNESVAVFADCVDLVAQIGSVTFKHCPREANKVAHELASYSFCNSQTCNWIDDIPSFLVSSLINDVTIIA